MKIAFTAAPVGRLAVRERQKRDRAVAPVLRAQYPKLATLQIDLEFSDRTGFVPSPQVTVFHPPARAYFCFACPYSDCDGELDLTRIVALMVNAGEARGDGQLNCAGQRHGCARCTLSVEYSLVARWLRDSGPREPG